MATPGKRSDWCPAACDCSVCSSTSGTPGVVCCGVSRGVWETAGVRFRAPLTESEATFSTVACAAVTPDHQEAAVRTTAPVRSRLNSSQQAPQPGGGTNEESGSSSGTAGEGRGPPLWKGTPEEKEREKMMTMMKVLVMAER
ncbi:unnamed protein product [Pleuronectes platessa]|uniref:Uncharacterized protein n=1 Tax=Pleuronectes platessa TaxID=8262 RepID=A0A9N7YQK0_PLEPL|nr:unnamed protein product [Pleuronectes platessa]